MTCVRCRTAQALPHQDGLCAPCTVSTRLEASAGIRRLTEYLAAWAAFDAWSRDRHGRGAVA
jgi:hypothetical protein